MTHYTLTWRNADALAPADGAALRPDVLCELSREAVEATELHVGRTRAPIAHFFDVAKSAEGHNNDRDFARLTIRKAPPLDRFGAGMTTGELIIEGDAGDDLGASMRGGLIRVTGSAGARVGTPDIAQPRGMMGGEILITGNAGDDVGLRMRGGLIAIAGTCGRSPGYRMLAGTIVINRGPLKYPGLEMRRGTIICLDASADITCGVSFTDDGVMDASALPALAVLLRHLKDLQWSSGTREGASASRWRLLSGDRFELHRGEVIQCLS